MIRFRCIDATRSHYSVFAQKRRGKHPFLSVHIDPSDNKYGAIDIRFCAFTLIQSVFENLRFCGAFVQINVNIITKTEVILSVFLQTVQYEWGLRLRSHGSVFVSIRFG